MVEADYLKARVEQRGSVCVLAVGGELDLLTVARFARSATAALKVRAERFVLDLSQLRFVDCCGVRALTAATRAVPAGCMVTVRSVSPAAGRVLDLMGVNLEPRKGGAGSDAARLALQSQLLRSLARQAIAESYRLAETIAATDDSVADTLIRLADGRPQKADRLVALSQTARAQAAHVRSRAASPLRAKAG